MRVRFGCLLAGIILLVVAPENSSAQSFEVASIKPADPAGTGSTFQFPAGGGLRIANATTRQIIETAWYDFRDFQIVGGPSWLNAARYDITAKSGSPAPDGGIPEVRKKLRALLAERFRLQVHTETRDLPTYVLVAAKNGPKLDAAGSPDSPTPTGIQTSCGRMIGTKTTLSNLAAYLSRQLHRPVEDRTGLTGTYTFRLEWTPDDTSCPQPNDGPSLFTALQEKLGLRLESTKAPQEVLVIDRAERPLDN